MKFKLALAVLLTPMMAFASDFDSGVYFDPEYNGEGVFLINDGNTYLMAFFTYGAQQCEFSQVLKTETVEISVTATATAECPLGEDDVPLCDPVTVTETATETKEVEYETTVPQCDINGTRWFLATDPYKKSKNVIEGLLYSGEAIDYPMQFISQSPNNPFGFDVADTFPVASYTMQPLEDGGWVARFFPLDDDGKGPLKKNDPLFERLFFWDSVLLIAD